MCALYMCALYMCALQCAAWPVEVRDMQYAT